MTTIEKQKIVDNLSLYIHQIGSQNKAANALKGITSGTISQMRNGNWKNISDSMFRNVALQLGCDTDSWKFAPTRNSKDLLEMFAQAKSQKLIFSVLGNAGSGKSETIKHYCKNTPDAVKVECGSYWDARYFLQEILRNMGVKAPSYRISDMMNDIIKRLKEYPTPPILIIDEADKLEDKILRFLITFYNELRGKCAIVLVSTFYFKKRLHDGLRLRKNGYEELMSRFGRFVEFQETSAEDVTAICRTNGIEIKATIRDIARRSNGDLRHVHDLVIAKKMENV